MNSSLDSLVRELRQEKDWTQEYLAEKAGVSHRAIQRIESGETKKPNSGTLQRLAAALEVDVSVLQEARRGGIAADTVQAVDCPPSNDTTATSIPRYPTEATTPSRNERQPISWRVLFEAVRRRRVIYLVIAAVVFLLILAVFVLMTTSWTKSNKVTISGKVLCIDNERVVGVWVSAVNGGSNFANSYKTNSNGSEAAFWYDLPNGSGYNIHVGCGGSKQDWENADYTENGSGMIKDHNFHYFTCQDIPLVAGHGPCYLKQ